MTTAAAVAAAPIAAQEPSAAPSDEIVVTALKGMWTLEGKRIRAAQIAFLEGRPRYAPTARMGFQMIAKSGGTLAGVRLTLRKDDDLRPVPLDAEGRFDLPMLDSDGWRLTANRTPAQVGVRLLIFSAGTREDDRRVGDLRLLCRVGWALIRDRYSFIQRGGFAALGGCDSSRFAIYTATSRPIVAATADAGGKPIALPLASDGRHYRMPLADKRLPDDARIRLTYR